MRINKYCPFKCICINKFGEGVSEVSQKFNRHVGFVPEVFGNYAVCVKFSGNLSGYSQSFGP